MLLNAFFQNVKYSVFTVKKHKILLFFRYDI